MCEFHRNPMTVMTICLADPQLLKESLAKGPAATLKLIPIFKTRDFIYFSLRSANYVASKDMK